MNLSTRLSSLPRDAIAGTVVFLVALPLCLGIANASGVEPFAGLISGIVVALLSGSPLSVSGPAAVESVAPRIAADTPAAAPSFAASTDTANRSGAVGSTAPAARPPHASADPEPDLTVEVALVQQATRALGAHEGDRALNVLDQYRARCPRRLLGEEAGVLRVRALVMVGRVAEGKALARRLRDANPQGVLAGKLDAVLEAPGVP